MIVRNRRTGKEYTITTDDWKKLTEQKKHRYFEVINTSDVQPGKILVPKIIQEFQVNTDKLKITKPKPKTNE